MLVSPDVMFGATNWKTGTNAVGVQMRGKAEADWLQDKVGGLAEMV